MLWLPFHLLWFALVNSGLNNVKLTTSLWNQANQKSMKFSNNLKKALQKSEPNPKLHTFLIKLITSSLCITYSWLHQKPLGKPLPTGKPTYSKASKALIVLNLITVFVKNLLNYFSLILLMFVWNRYAGKLIIFNLWIFLLTWRTSSIIWI